jgi:NADH-quinone oxidoreductase subunit L
VSALALYAPLLAFVGAVAGFALCYADGRHDGEARRATRPAALVACASSTGAALLTVVVAVGHGTGAVQQTMLRLAPTGRVEIWLGARVDGLAALVAVLVGVVAVAVQVYSTTYMRDDPRYRSYAALVSLFTAAMLLVVYSADLLVLLVGWEVMGACSYFLIGQHWERRAARAAAVKAFLVTKTGDVPFLFGVFVLALDAHTFRVDGVLAAAQAGRLPHVTLAALLLLGGVVGKSAQFPLHTWLPDAMAGPTPVSALIHAATMVAAGVFLVARLYPVFLAAPAALAVLAVLAAITMPGAALAAFAQPDLKRVLAYSTVSQLAYMAGGLAVDGRGAAVLHLLSHGAFKALLFLGAGVLAHRVGSNELADMGGLRRRLPVTFVTMTIGLAALAAVPPFAGFFSKDAIIGAAYTAARTPVAGGPYPWTAWLVLVAALLAAIVTAGYATRVWLRAFFGPRRDEPSGGGREAPASQLVPLVVLAVPATLLGVSGLRRGWFPRWLGGADGERLAAHAVGHDLAPSAVSASLSLVAALLGVVVVWAAWRRAPDADPARLLGPARAACVAGFGVDRLQQLVVVRPVLAASRLVAALDIAVVDGYARGSGVAARLLGGGLRRSQNGNAQLYLTGVLTGVLVIAVIVGTSGGIG